MNREVIVSCAVTGGAEPAQHRAKSPREIADAAIEAAQAGAAIAHIHADALVADRSQSSRQIGLTPPAIPASRSASEA